MRRLGVLVLLAFAALTGSASAYSRVVSRDGRVGPFQLDRTTTGRVAAIAGRPDSRSEAPGEGGVAVIEWTYGCGRGKAARYFFTRSGLLANFVTDCHSWRTANGTRIGMSRSQAEDREGKEAQTPACGDGLTITRRGRAELFVTFTSDQSPVRALAVAGRHSVLGC